MKLLPETACHFVAERLRISPDALPSYAARRQTRREQLDALRKAFDFRTYTPGHGRELLSAMAEAFHVCRAAPAYTGLFGPSPDSHVSRVRPHGEVRRSGAAFPSPLKPSSRAL